MATNFNGKAWATLGHGAVRLCCANKVSNPFYLFQKHAVRASRLPAPDFAVLAP